MSFTMKVFFTEREENEPSEIRRFQWQLSSNLEQLKVKLSNVLSVKLEPELISISGRGVDGKNMKIESDSDLFRVYGRTSSQSTVKLWATMLETEECVAKNRPRIETDRSEQLVADGMCENYEDLQFESRDCEFDAPVCKTEELYTDLWPKIETETLLTSPNSIQSEKKLVIETDYPAPEPNELDSPQLDARFCTSYGKNAMFANAMRLMKDCFSTVSAPEPTDLSPQFVESLCTLREMGFDVENPNVLKILRRNNGNLDKTIEEVLNSSF